MMPKDSKPAKHQIVLVGAGNSHLQIVNRWRMNPIEETQLTLINDCAWVPYSGMLPGTLSGQYTPEQTHVDITRLCAVSNVSLVLSQVTKVDWLSKRLSLKDRAPLGYDILALNIGSQPAPAPSSIPQEKLLTLKPLHQLISKLENLESKLQSHPKKFEIVIVGAGASGCEIAFALRRRFADQAKITLLSSSDLVPNLNAGVRRHCLKSFEKAEITTKTKTSVQSATESALSLSDGSQLSYDLCVWATTAAPLELIADSNFETDEKGFIQAEDTLLTTTDSNVFATGDCVTLRSHPQLPKAGVFAVRQGPYLWENFKRKIQGQALKAYHPQKTYLFLLNTNDGNAIVSYGPFSAKGSWAWQWKNFIDRRWMRKLTGPYGIDRMQMSEEDEQAMRCGGCAAKVPAEVLSRVFEKLQIPTREEILIGRGDDASVHRPPQGQVEVQTVDFFRSFLTDPYLFGKIAANNAISDLHAMNATPFSALAIVTVPLASGAIQEDLLFQILSGALDTFKEENIILTGGHTSESQDLGVGFAVTGYAAETSLFKKGSLQSGDQLILTKPLGSGAMLAAQMRGELSHHHYTELVEGMLQSNGDGAKVLSELGVSACTDITGFGLGGHLLEMLEASKLGATIYSKQLPRYSGFEPVVQKEIFSTLHKENLKKAHRMKNSEALPLLFDPQTSGGLLAGTPKAKVTAVLRRLATAGFEHSTVIGEVTTPSEKPMIDVLSDP